MLSEGRKKRTKEEHNQRLSYRWSCSTVRRPDTIWQEKKSIRNFVFLFCNGKVDHRMNVCDVKSFSRKKNNKTNESFGYIIQFFTLTELVVDRWIEIHSFIHSFFLCLNEVQLSASICVCFHLIYFFVLFWLLMTMNESVNRCQRCRKQNQFFETYKTCLNCSKGFCQNCWSSIQGKDRASRKRLCDVCSKSIDDDEEYQLALAISLSQSEEDQRKKIQMIETPKHTVNVNNRTLAMIDPDEILFKRMSDAIQRFMNRAKSDCWFSIDTWNLKVFRFVFFFDRSIWDQRQRDVITDTAFLSAFLIMQTCMNDLEQLKNRLDRERLYFENLQEKLTNLREARLPSRRKRISNDDRFVFSVKLWQFYDTNMKKRNAPNSIGVELWWWKKSPISVNLNTINCFNEQVSTSSDICKFRSINESQKKTIIWTRLSLIYFYVLFCHSESGSERIKMTETIGL